MIGVRTRASRARLHYPAELGNRQQRPGGILVGDRRGNGSRVIKRQLALVGFIFGALLFANARALAQDLPGLPGMRQAQDALERQNGAGGSGPRQPRAPRQPGAPLQPRVGGIAPVVPRAPGEATDRETPRTRPSKTDSGLPHTGQNFVLMWLAAGGLVATGAVLVVVRRRLRAPTSP